MGHLHPNVNFAESRVETARKSLRHSCRSELTRQGISPLRTVIVGRRFGASIAARLAADHPLNLPAPAGVSPYTSPYGLAEACVLVNSRYCRFVEPLGFWSSPYTCKGTPYPEVTVSLPAP